MSNDIVKVKQEFKRKNLMGVNKNKKYLAGNVNNI
jgi:hypothetical protein